MDIALATQYTRRMYRAMEGFTVSSGPLPDGDQGTRKTLDNMRRLADEGSRDLAVRGTAASVVRSSGAAPHNPLAQTQALFEYVRDCIYFLADPAGTEWLQSPRYTLASGAGDCDDRATLLASMLRSIGITSCFKVVAVDPSRRDTFSHVYLVANVMGRPLPLDPTYPQNAMGFEYPNPYRSAMVSA